MRSCSTTLPSRMFFSVASIFRDPDVLDRERIDLEDFTEEAVRFRALLVELDPEVLAGNVRRRDVVHARGEAALVALEDDRLDRAALDLKRSVHAPDPPGLALFGEDQRAR